MSRFLIACHWHITWLGVRPQRARRQHDGARMSARALPVERSRSCRTRAPRHGCQPCLRESRPRAASRRHYPRVRVALVGDTHSSRAVRPTGACRAPATNAAHVCAFDATMARPPPCFLTGQGGACSRSARNRRFPPPPPAWAATGGRQPLRGWQARVCGAHEPSLNHTPPAPVLHQVKVKRSYQPGGQGRRAGGRGQGRLFQDSREMPHAPRARQFAEHLLPTRG